MPPSGRSRAAQCATPTKYGKLSGLSVGADDLGGPRAHTVRPYDGKRTTPPESFPSSVWPTASHPPLTFVRPQGPPLRRKWTGSVDWANPGAAVEMHHLKFYAKPGPSGPEEIAECHSDFARRKGCTMFKG